MIVTRKASGLLETPLSVDCLHSSGWTVQSPGYSQLQEIMVKFAFLRDKPQPIRVRRESTWELLVRQNQFMPASKHMVLNQKPLCPMVCYGLLVMYNCDDDLCDTCAGSTNWGFNFTLLLILIRCIIAMINNVLTYFSAIQIIIWSFIYSLPPYPPPPSLPVINKQCCKFLRMFSVSVL